jgi:hypothetical protein
MISIQAQPFRKKKRYHWMVCVKDNPDELVSWGHAATQEEAESQARDEVRDLTAGLTQGGRVADIKRPYIRNA